MISLKRCMVLVYIIGVTVVTGGVLYAGDERVVINNTEVYPYNHIVMVGYDSNGDMILGAFGSGALVGPHMVLTAGHVVYNRNEGHYNYADKYIIPGASRGGSSGSIMASSSVAVDAPYGYREAVRLSTNSKFADLSYSDKGDVDYGAIFIECPFQDLTVYMPLGFEYEPDYLKMSGYPVEDLTDNSHLYDQWFDGGDRLKIWDRQIGYDIYSSGGASGSPVWRSGDELVIGVNRSHSTNWAPYPGLGTRLVSQNENLISTWLEWEPGSGTICLYKSGIITSLSSIQEVIEHLKGIQLNKNLKVIAPEKWNIMDAPPQVSDKPSRSIYQYIGGVLFNWKEYNVPNDESDSPAFLRYLVIQKPIKKSMTAEQAGLLMTISATWKEELPANEEATTFKISPTAVGIEMPVVKITEFNNFDTTLDEEYQEQ